MGEMENIIVIKDCDQALIRLRGETFIKLLALASLTKTYKAFRKMVVSLLQLISQLSFTIASLLFIVLAAFFAVIFYIVQL